MQNHPHIVPASDPVAPTISVIVPAYNSRATIERCITSLATQRTEHRFEVIVVDSGRDDTAEIVEAVLPPARAVKLKDSAVPPKARNIGAKLARGRILAFLDSDTHADQEWINNVVTVAAGGYDLVCGSVENGKPRSAVSRAEHLLQFSEFLPGNRQRRAWFAVSANMVLQRASFERFGPFAEIRAAEDVVFSRKLIAAGGSILFYPGLRVFHHGRTELRPYLKNQILLGRHTAIARRIVSFGNGQYYWLFLLLLPVAPIVKLARLAIRSVCWDPRNLQRILESLPLLSVGVCTYCAGMVAGAVTPVRQRRAQRPVTPVTSN